MKQILAKAGLITLACAAPVMASYVAVAGALEVVAAAEDKRPLRLSK